MTRLLGLAAAAALLVVACGPQAAHAPGGPPHACADKVAQAAVDGDMLIGDCLDPSLQKGLTDAGRIDESSGRWHVGDPFAKSWRYVGAAKDAGSAAGLTAEVYELTRSKVVDGWAGQLLIVYVDDQGKVTAVAVTRRVL